LGTAASGSPNAYKEENMKKRPARKRRRPGKVRPVSGKGSSASPAFALFVAGQHDPRIAFWLGKKPDRRVRALRLVFTSKNYTFNADIEDRDFIHDLAAYLCGPAHGFEPDADSLKGVAKLTPDEVFEILKADREKLAKLVESQSRAKSKPPKSDGRPANPERLRLGEFAHSRMKANEPPPMNGRKRWTYNLVGIAYELEHPKSELIPRNDAGKPQWKAFTKTVNNARRDYVKSLGCNSLFSHLGFHASSSI
jgi:hypothetical protein